MPEIREFEYILPGHELPYFFFQSSLNRLNFAAGLVKEKVVLEVACGTGYGASYLLSRGAKQVIGADISPEAISLAQTHFSREGLHFVRCDARELPFSADSFDAVVSFETIEHFRESAEFLSECKRVLKPGGFFLCSTPNRKVHSTLWGKPVTPYHKIEFSPEELGSLVRRYFPELQLLGQRFLNRKARLEAGLRRYAEYILTRIMGRRKGLMVATKLGKFIFRQDFQTLLYREDRIKESLHPNLRVLPLAERPKHTPYRIIILATKSD